MERKRGNGDLFNGNHLWSLEQVKFSRTNSLIFFLSDTTFTVFRQKKKVDLKLMNLMRADIRSDEWSKNN